MFPLKIIVNLEWLLCFYPSLCLIASTFFEESVRVQRVLGQQRTQSVPADIDNIRVLKIGMNCIER